MGNATVDIERVPHITTLFPHQAHVAPSWPPLLPLAAYRTPHGTQGLAAPPRPLGPPSSPPPLAEAKKGRQAASDHASPHPPPTTPRVANRGAPVYSRLRNPSASHLPMLTPLWTTHYWTERQNKANGGGQ